MKQLEKNKFSPITEKRKKILPIFVMSFIALLLFMLPMKVKAEAGPTFDEAEAYIRSLNKKTDYEIFEEIVKFCAHNYDYDYNYSSAEDMIKYGGGTCWASTDFIVKMCKRFNIEAAPRNANREAGAGSGHMNAIAKIGSTYYIGEAGFNGTKPRYYRIYEEPGGYWVNRDGVLLQYDGFDEDVYIPEKVGNITVKAIGLSPQNEYETGYIVTQVDQKIKTIHLPKTVETVCPEAFLWNYGLDNFYVDNDNPYIKAVNGLLLTKDGKQLLAVPKHKSDVIIPKGVEVIPPLAFWDSRNVKELILPDGVTTIGEKAFYSCYIERILMPKTIKKIGKNAFYQTVRVPFLAVPAGTVIEGNETFAYLNDTYPAQGAVIYTDGEDIEKYVNSMKIMRKEIWYINGERVEKEKQWPNPKVKYIKTVYNGIDYSKAYNYYDYCASHLELWRSCNGDPDVMLEDFVKNIVLPNGIGLSCDSLKLEKGQKRQITATVVPGNAIQTVTFSCSNPAVAEVDENGNITAKSVGEAVITGTTINGKTSNCKVTVIVSPSSITFDKTSATLYFGETLNLTATLAPTDVTEKTIRWSISNSGIASVNNGTVRVWGAGKVKVTATTTNGLTAVCDILILSEDNPDNPFADIKAASWKYNAAMYVYEKGHMTGKGELVPGKILFSPDAPIKRSEFVQTLYSVQGKPETEYIQKFNDVEEGAWYAKAVTWASNSGVVAGNPDGTFGVNGKATREQLAVMLYQYAAYKGLTTDVAEEEGKRISDFSDAGKVSGWAENALNWALTYGIISGTGEGKINPKGNATRVECAAMLKSFLTAVENGTIEPADPTINGEELMEPMELPEDIMEEPEEEVAEEPKEVEAPEKAPEKEADESEDLE